MTTRTGNTPRIAILGGGIGGLATAAFLRREGFDATVFEQAPRIAEVGAGLVVAPNAARQLRCLGVLEELAKSVVRLETGWEFRRWQDGTVLSVEDLASSCERLYGEHTYTAHRADLLAAIQSRVSAEAVVLGRKCVRLGTGGGSLRLDFADGESAEADIVIGADGVHSIVRNTLFGASPAAYSGLCAFRALVPADQAPEFARRPAQTLWIGPGHHLVHYPVSGGEYINLVAFAPAGDYTTESWTATATVDEFLAEFEGWDPRLTDLIRAAGVPGRWALLDREPLTQWSEGGVTLLGDAAHPMFPFFAQGAAQAIEDAAVLARCLAEGADDPATALRRYESIRIPRTTKLQAVSHMRAQINHLPDGPEQQRRDQSFAHEDPLLVNGWIYGYDPEASFVGSAVVR
ncbi:MULTISPECIES: FAD-dependent monooxygenase [unclassified Rhodococcus (in: high G+C Gram-positive bacteria)]|uniref:FAD-dependent monooxygenase n=1 Tax=unclassified Rhodococcus (in: high G+C Gram-positive bacteria) TaxID=192944 RepID=UPI00163B2ACA|nr:MULTISPECIES: FAD-dependent monooxygenase [unclassified Rhodococcus (in: high G+C Gram-positive bacteria)]MBC2638194.1 FAD-dependent monooxygenase [Rhodococcus sp. 3A]MBC2897063.1 FAD-dependent monooxygenase [Rhodococcus sp. 4CII]